MQSFWDGDRQLALAGLFNWEVRKPAGSAYSGELSLSRVLTLDRHRRLLMNPEAGIATLRTRRLEAADGKFRPAAGCAVDVSLSGELAGLTLVGTSGSGDTVTLTQTPDGLTLKLSEEDGRITYHSAPVELTDIRLFFDRGVIELFANGGLICGTRRSYRVVDVTSLWISGQNSGSIEVWEYRSAWSSD